MTVTRVGDGLYRVVDERRTWIVAVAGPPQNRWVWVDGHSARLDQSTTSKGDTRAHSSAHDLASPMPATVVRVIAQVGQQVARGDTLLMLEAMKMELPIRSPRDGVVSAVHCKEGELVQPGVHLIDLA